MILVASDTPFFNVKYKDHDERKWSAIALLLSSLVK